MRIVLATVVVCVAASLCVPLGVAAGREPVDYGIRVVGPVDRAGRRTHTRVTAGVPFLVGVELFTDAAVGAASVSYDVELPTAVKVAAKPVRLATGAITSTCLRSCTVGWNTDRSQRLFVYYALVTPGAGEFIFAARIATTNGRDARGGDNTGSAAIVAVAARLIVGPPRLGSGAPRAGETFTIAVPVRRGGVPVLLGSVRCVATIGRRTLRGAAALARGRAACRWRIPAGSAGSTLRTTVTVTVGSLRAEARWAFAVRRTP